MGTPSATTASASSSPPYGGIRASPGLPCTRKRGRRTEIADIDASYCNVTGCVAVRWARWAPQNVTLRRLVVNLQGNHLFGCPEVEALADALRAPALTTLHLDVGVTFSGVDNHLPTLLDALARRWTVGDAAALRQFALRMEDVKADDRAVRSITHWVSVPCADDMLLDLRANPAITADGRAALTKLLFQRSWTVRPPRWIALWLDRALAAFARHIADSCYGPLVPHHIRV